MVETHRQLRRDRNTRKMSSYLRRFAAADVSDGITGDQWRTQEFRKGVGKRHVFKGTSIRLELLLKKKTGRDVPRSVRGYLKTR